MTINDILPELATADAAKLAKIAAVLHGTDGTPERSEDCRLITVKGAADKLQVSRPTVYRLIAKGRLERVMLADGFGRIRLKSLIDYVNGLR